MVAKDNRNIFFWTIDLYYIPDICDMSLGKKSYPILKYLKENNSINRRMVRLEKHNTTPKIMPPLNVCIHTHARTYMPLRAREDPHLLSNFGGVGQNNLVSEV